MSENAHDKLLHDLAAGGINRAKIGGFDIDGVLRGRSCRPPGASPDAAACAQALSGLRERIGLTGGLGGAGVPRGGLEKLAGLAFEDACHRSSARPASRADLLALYQASFA